MDRWTGEEEGVTGMLRTTREGGKTERRWVDYGGKVVRSQATVPAASYPGRTDSRTLKDVETARYGPSVTLVSCPWESHPK